MTSRSFSSTRAIVAALMIALSGIAFVASAGSADARLGGGGSFGSRGSRTFSMPSATPTAPSMAPLGRPSSGFGSSAPGFGASRPGFLGGGFGRGLLGGFLGAGLFGMLFGSGFGGGLGGGMSLIGLVLQLGLLYLAFRFIMGFFRNRQSAFGGGQGGSLFGGQPAAGPQGGGFMNGGAQGPQGTPITIAPADYQTFEQRLVESQMAYSEGDIATLRRVATPDMAGSFEQELATNTRQGVVNKLSNVHLMKGDLSEAWREGSTDYATVAMQFSLIDTTIDQRTGRVVSGNPTAPQTVTEVWTFLRPSGGNPAAWTLSAIQQA